MDRLIREMSYFFTKARFEEVKDNACQIAIGNCDYHECLCLIADEIAEYVENTREDVWREHEKIIMRYISMCALALWGNGEKVTDAQWQIPAGSYYRAGRDISVNTHKLKFNRKAVA